MTRRTTALADDEALDTQRGEQQQVRIVSALGAPTPLTRGASSVFAAGQAAKPKRRYGPRNPVNPDAVVIEQGVPIPPRVQSGPGESAYAKLFARMPVNASVVLTTSQGNAFMKWAQVRKCTAELVRRAHEDGQVRVWRVAPKLPADKA